MTVDALRLCAQAALDPATWSYLTRGDEGEAAWTGQKLCPQVLRGVDAAETSTTILGQHVSAPIMIAPNGRATRYHPDGENAVLTGAGGAITLLASSIGPSLAALRALHPGAPIWQQLYFVADRAHMRDRLAAIRASGCGAVVLTADLLPDGKGGSPAPPIASWETPDPYRPARHSFTGATLDDLAWLCGEAGLPVVVKGVLRADDAAACVAVGASAVIVSNHGNNQLAGAISSADALRDVVQAAGAAEVYVDGGIRSGATALKALALGASAVLVGRPASFALAADGADGIAAMLAGLSEELARAMALCGVASLADLDPSLVSAERSI